MNNSLTITYVVLILMAFFFSVFFSASETIFSTVDLLKVKVWIKTNRFGSRLVKQYLQKPDRFLIPILVGNNIANVVYALSIAHLLTQFSSESLSHSTVVILETLILVLFAEIIPKIIAKNNSENLMLMIIIPFKIFDIILTPINLLMNCISRQFLRMIGYSSYNEENLLVTKKEIHRAVNEAVCSSGVVDDSVKIMQNILDMHKIKVREEITHRKNIVGVDVNDPVFKVKRLIILTSYSKIIVYKKEIDNILGVIYAKDIINKNPKKIADAMKPIKIVPDASSLYQVFKEFQSEKLSISAVVDEFGGLLGILTMQDIFEAIVGKVTDIHRRNLDRRGISYRPDSQVLIVNGEVSLDDYNEKVYQITDNAYYLIEDKTHETINGFIINYLQRIPVQGETFSYHDLTYKVAKARRNKVEVLTVNLNNIKKNRNKI